MRYAPTAEGPQAAALAIGYIAPGATSPIVVPITAVGHVFNVTAQSDVTGTVPSTLALNVSGPAPSLGTFVPGRAMDYTTALTVGVTSSGGNAALTVQDPSATATGHLVNGAFSLAAAAAGQGGCGDVRADRVGGEPADAGDLRRPGGQRAGRDRVQAVDRGHGGPAHRHLQQDGRAHAVDDRSVGLTG